MTLPKIEIIDSWAYLNGTKLRKKILLKSSHCRDIFYNNDFVVKIPIDSGDENQSKREYHLWKNKILKCDRPYFAECVIYHRKEKFLVQKKIKMKSRKRTDEDFKIIEYICQKYKIDDVEDRDDNWCINAETNLPCIFDYGIRM